jgi:Spy/CpxP family protein refolding chaperone
MKLLPCAQLLLAGCLAFNLLHAEEPAPKGDAMSDAFFAPELILFTADKLGLTDQQRLTIRARVEAAQPQAKEFQDQLAREADALSRLVHQPHIDEAALQKQLDLVLDAERGVKQVHLGTLAALKNMLTPEQQTQLAELAKNDGGLQEEVRQRLTSKAQQFKAGIEKMQAAGRDPAPIGAVMQDFEPLLKSGKLAEAEAVLDRALKAVEEATK